MDARKVKKGAWVWQKEWWWVIAMNEVIARKLKLNPGDSVTFKVSEVNEMIHELAGSLPKRLRALASFPVRVSLKGGKEIIIEEG